MKKKRQPRVGDIVKKIGGYLPDIDIGIVVAVDHRPENVVEVLTMDGYENWVISFCKIINR